MISTLTALGLIWACSLVAFLAGWILASRLHAGGVHDLDEAYQRGVEDGQERQKLAALNRMWGRS